MKLIEYHNSIHVMLNKVSIHKYSTTKKPQKTIFSLLEVYFNLKNNNHTTGNQKLTFESPLSSSS